MKIKDIKGYEEFTTYCCFELCEKHYPGWVGEEKYIIITDAQEMDLLRDFPEMMAALSPYVIIRRYFKHLNEKIDYNELKHSSQTDFSTDEIADYEHRTSQYACPDFSESLCLSDSLHEALLNLSEPQRSRIIRRYFLEMTVEEIAKQDKTAHSSVSESIQSGLKKLKKSLS